MVALAGHAAKIQEPAKNEGAIVVEIIVPEYPELQLHPLGIEVPRLLPGHGWGWGTHAKIGGWHSKGMSVKLEFNNKNEGENVAVPELRNVYDLKPAELEYTGFPVVALASI